jgi:hypothetical protein
MICENCFVSNFNFLRIDAKRILRLPVNLIKIKGRGVLQYASTHDITLIGSINDIPE